MDWNDIKEIDEEALRRESEELLALRYLTPDNARFSATPGGFVSLYYQGKHYGRVSIYRTFPNTQPDSWLSVREPDEKAKEIGMIEELDRFPKEQADLIRQQLDLRYYTPHIQKFLEVKDEYGYAYFEAETTYGRCRFTIQMGAGSIVPLSENMYQITDLDGNRYIIDDITALTVAEQRKLDLYL